MQDQPNKLHLCSVFTRDLQRNRSSSISTGIKREVLLELSHKIKDEKSHNLFSANWRTSNAGGIIQHDFKGPFPSGSDGKASACTAGDPGSIPGPGRCPGEGNGNLHQYSFFFPFIFISWRLITLQYCSGFCHTLTWISHGFTCIPHLDPPSHLPLHPIPLGLPSYTSTLAWKIPQTEEPDGLLL